MQITSVFRWSAAAASVACAMRANYPQRQCKPHRWKIPASIAFITCRAQFVRTAHATLASTGLGTSSAAPLKIAFEAVRIFTRLEYDNLLKRATPSSSPTPYHLPIDNKIKISVMNSNSTFETTGMIADTFRNDFSDTELLSGHAGIGGSGIATGGGRLYIAVYDADAYNADIYLKIKFATPAYMPLKPKVDYASADFTVSFVDMEKQLLLADEWFSKNQLDSHGKIGVYENHKSPMLGSPSAPILFKNGVKITVIVKLPLSTSTDKLEGKGLGGHTGIAIRDNFYDYGPSGSALSSPGTPWWDEGARRDYGLSSVDDVTLEKIKRYLTATIIPRQNIYFVTFFVTEAEASAVERWWRNKYHDMGTYRVWLDQCTTTVKNSLQEAGIFRWFEIGVQTTLKPATFLEHAKTVKSTTGFQRGEKADVFQFLSE